MDASALQTSAVDTVFWISMVISVLLLLLVTVVMIYFVIRYHRRRHPRPEPVKSNTLLEIVWTLVPLILVMLIFYYGTDEFWFIRNPPKNAMIVKVTGQQWKWSFEYENGKRSDDLYVPVNRPVKLLLHSLDVIHGFYLPAFRIKEDVVPGRENYLWFKPETMGPADIFCSSYCGLSHAYMMSRVIVMSQPEFDKWYGGTPSEPQQVQASVLQILDKHDCTGCHSLDGTASVGPTFKGLYNRTQTVLMDGEEQTRPADEAYLRESILEPGKAKVKGSTADMPVPENLSETDLTAIIEYLKTLK
jgi:cytochrome c oxidase subunit 2